MVASGGRELDEWATVEGGRFVLYTLPFYIFEPYKCFTDSA